MNKKISLGAAIAFMAIVAAATLSITMMLSRRSYNDKVSDLLNREERYAKIALIDQLVRENYIGTPGQEELMNSIARGFIAGIGDPFSEYYDASQYARLTSDLEGKSVQIGIVTDMDESGYIKVTEVYPDSPAEAAGIENGNLIVRIDETDVTAENYNEAINMLRGEPGTKMTILVRKGVDESSLEMTRRFVETPSVFSTMLANNIGLVTLKEFSSGTADQFVKQVDGLIDQGALGLIFDLRGVSEGTLAAMAPVLDKLLPKGTIASSADKTGALTVLATSDAREVTLPMSVVVDEKTACEAELFAVALRDYSKAQVVGVRTAGKGTIQRLIPLSDGTGAVRITTGVYQPPVSPSFNLEGIKPDYEVKLSEDQIARMKAGDPDSDLQMKKAMEVVGAAMKAAGSLPSDAQTNQTPTPVETSSSSSAASVSQPEGESSEDPALVDDLERVAEEDTPSQSSSAESSSEAG